MSPILRSDKPRLETAFAETGVFQIEASGGPATSAAASRIVLQRKTRSELDQLDVFGTRTFRPLTLSEGYFLAFAEFLKGNALQRLRMEKQVFRTAGIDESKTLVRQLFNRAFGHLFVSLTTAWEPLTGIRLPTAAARLLVGL